jgi:bifunctional pyridoxal-dependent enzyme with beta-cystathionase and maltose regulon repressor activities
VNLRSAVEFILTLDASVINMDAAEFEKKLAENERRYYLAHPDEPPPVPKPRDD